MGETKQLVVNTGTITAGVAVDFDVESIYNFGVIGGGKTDLDTDYMYNGGVIYADDQLDIDLENGVNNGILSAGVDNPKSIFEINSPESPTPTLSATSIVANETSSSTVTSSTVSFEISMFLIALIWMLNKLF